MPPGTQLAEKQELVRNNGSEPASLDPHKVESDVEFNIISDLFEGLVNVSPAGAIQPRLAERWENKDNLLWTFHLRPGLTWSDSTAITAQDIVWSWQRLVSPATASPTRATTAICISPTPARLPSGKGTRDVGGESAERHHAAGHSDPAECRLPAMLAHPSLVPIDKVLVERYADKWTRPEHIVTSGPYKLSQWVVNERLVAERNAKYWDNAHTVINKVTYLPISSRRPPMSTATKQGRLILSIRCRSIQFAQLQKTMGDQLDVSPQLATYYYEFNTTRPPFNDARVRRALNMALDKDIIAGKVLGQASARPG